MLYYKICLTVVAGPRQILVCVMNTLLLILKGARQHRVSHTMQRDRHSPHHTNQHSVLLARGIVTPPCPAHRCVPRRSECRDLALAIHQPLIRVVAINQGSPT